MGASGYFGSEIEKHLLAAEVFWHQPIHSPVDVKLRSLCGFTVAGKETGMIPEQLCQVDYVVCGVRLEQRESIAWWLEQCTPQHVICAAGTAGTNDNTY